MPPHADAKPALSHLQAANYRTVAFTNSSLNLVTNQINNAGLTGYYDEIVSVEETGSFKPDPMVYKFVAKRIRRSIDGLRLVAAHDWDTHGAITAGMLAAYIDRTGAPYHPLYHRPEVYATTLGNVVGHIIARDRE